MGKNREIPTKSSPDRMLRSGITSAILDAICGALIEKYTELHKDQAWINAVKAAKTYLRHYQAPKRVGIGTWEVPSISDLKRVKKLREEGATLAELEIRVYRVTKGSCPCADEHGTRKKSICVHRAVVNIVEIAREIGKEVGGTLDDILCETDAYT